MGNDFDVSVKGLDELRKKLDSLGKVQAGKFLRTSMREAMKPVRDAAVSVAPYNTGATKASIKLKAAKLKNRNPGIEVVIGEGWFKGKTFYAAFIEFGYTLRNGVKMPGKGWLRKCYLDNRKSSSQAAMNATWKRVREFMKFRIF